MTGMSTGDGDVDYNVGSCNVMVNKLPLSMSCGNVSAYPSPDTPPTPPQTK